jgi:hypothetical protein
MISGLASAASFGYGVLNREDHANSTDVSSRAGRLSHLAGQGVFKAWNDYRLFQRVRVSDHRSIEWDNEIELCSDALYMQLTGKTPAELGFKLSSTSE